MGKVSEAQKGYQKKYDQKTKMVSVKYTPADMADYERMTAYLERTGQSTNSFIKKLINAFFENGESTKVTALLEEILVEEGAAHISSEENKKLEEMLGGDQERYNAIMRIYAEFLYEDIDTALEEESCVMDNWILNEFVNEGLSEKHGKEFEEAVRKSLENVLCEIMCNTPM